MMVDIPFIGPMSPAEFVLIGIMVIGLLYVVSRVAGHVWLAFKVVAKWGVVILVILLIVFLILGAIGA